MLRWPWRSPRSDSSRLAGGTRRSSRPTAASNMSSFARARCCRVTGRLRTATPEKTAAVCLSRKLLITIERTATRYVASTEDERRPRGDTQTSGTPASFGCGDALRAQPAIFAPRFIEGSARTAQFSCLSPRRSPPTVSFFLSPIPRGACGFSQPQCGFLRRSGWRPAMLAANQQRGRLRPHGGNDARKTPMWLQQGGVLHEYKACCDNMVKMTCAKRPCGYNKVGCCTNTRHVATTW